MANKTNTKPTPAKNLVDMALCKFSNGERHPDMLQCHAAVYIAISALEFASTFKQPAQQALATGTAYSALKPYKTKELLTVVDEEIDGLVPDGGEQETLQQKDLKLALKNQLKQEARDVIQDAINKVMEKRSDRVKLG